MGSFSEEERNRLRAKGAEMEGVEVLSATAALVQCSIEATPYRRLALRLHSTERYEEDGSLLVELSSAVLQDKVLERLGREVEAMLEAKHAGEQQLCKAVELMHMLVLKNRLLYCKPEIDEVMADKSLLQLSAKDSFKANAKRGTLLLEQHEGNYWVKYRLTVPEQYPSTPAEVRFLSSNIHSSIITVFQARVLALSDRVMNGYRYFLPVVRREMAAAKAAASAAAVGVEAATQPSTAALQGIKKDMKFLKQISELESRSEEKAMRRQKTRMVKKEKADMLLQEQEEADLARRSAYEEEQRELAAMLGDDSVLDAVHLTVKPLLSFVIEEVVRRLPSEPCPLCKDPLLPKKAPAGWGVAGKESAVMAKEVRVERLGCDHWYHYRCMEKFVAEPPFDNKVCLTCEREIQHTRWTRERISKLEQRWKKKVQRKRELEDVMDFMS